LPRPLPLTLYSYAGGVFRWADLQIHALALQEREKDIMKALKRLPKDLEATYERILKRIEDEDKSEEALAILRWLAFSSRSFEFGGGCRNRRV